MWDVTSALEVIRPLQFQALQFGFTLALGGGVLNNGTSSKDLDIVVLEMDGPRRVDGKAKFLARAEKYLGRRVPITADKPASVSEDADENVCRFEQDGRVVELLFYSRRSAK